MSSAINILPLGSVGSYKWLSCPLATTAIAGGPVTIGSRRRLSKRSKALLASGEGAEVEYKEHASGLSQDDIIAFANSECGGTILIGVREVSGLGGRQIGYVIGHTISDGVRLQIVNKALDCVPPVSVKLFVEQKGESQFYRLEIPSSPTRPHSTGSGSYKIREDGRNMPLFPGQLLQIFLDQEAKQFHTRFASATGRIEKGLDETLTLVGNLEGAISERIDKIGNSLGWAEYKAGDAADTIETVEAVVFKLIERTKRQDERIKSLLNTTGAVDPVKMRVIEDVKSTLRSQLSSSPEILKSLVNGGQISAKLTEEVGEEISKDELQSILSEVVLELHQTAGAGSQQESQGEKEGGSKND